MEPAKYTFCLPSSLLSSIVVALRKEAIIGSSDCASNVCRLGLRIKVVPMKKKNFTLGDQKNSYVVDIGTQDK